MRRKPSVGIGEKIAWLPPVPIKTSLLTRSGARNATINDVHAPLGRQRLDVLAIVACAGCPGAATMDQYGRFAFTEIVVARAGAGDIGEFALQFQDVSPSFQ